MVHFYRTFLRHMRAPVVPCPLSPFPLVSCFRMVFGQQTNKPSLSSVRCSAFCVNPEPSGPLSPIQALWTPSSGCSTPCSRGLFTSCGCLPSSAITTPSTGATDLVTAADTKMNFPSTVRFMLRIMFNFNKVLIILYRVSIKNHVRSYGSCST